jgi:pentatricopeptide repeat protein
MLAAGLQPNLVTYNTLLEVYAKRGMWREAVGVLDTLEQQVRVLPWQLQECCCVSPDAGIASCYRVYLC